MARKKTTRIRVHVPSNFLDEFDKEISGLYASRNEAIRAGMVLVLESEKEKWQRVSCLPDSISLFETRCLAVLIKFFKNSLFSKLG
jgi:Arc/MetJ-type ribon-helix-helix transcriptional regulator